MACLVTPPASLLVAGRTRSHSRGRTPALQSLGALPNVAHPVAGAHSPPRGQRVPSPASPAASSPSSFDDSDRDLALAALLDAQADLVPSRRGGPRGRRARGV